MIQMSRFIIVGDTDQYEGCLVCTCGTSKEHAEKTLNRMLNAPTENDKRIMEGHRNLRVKEVEKEKCWWEDA